MSDEILFINNDTFGDTYVGTRDVFKIGLADLFKTWYFEREKGNDSTHEEFVEASLDDGLEFADEDDIKRCQRL